MTVARKKRLSEPVFENGNVTADSAVGQIQFASRSRIAARARRDLERS
jgi:hypothetical protein